MTSFVQIVVNVPAVSGVFDYAVPESLAGKMGVGIIIPFGIKNALRKETGRGVFVLLPMKLRSR